MINSPYWIHITLHVHYNFHLTHVSENNMKTIIFFGKKLERERLRKIFDICYISLLQNKLLNNLFLCNGMSYYLQKGYLFNPFLVNIPILYPLKTLKNQSFSVAFRGIKLEHWSEMDMYKLLLLSFPFLWKISEQKSIFLAT